MKNTLTKADAIARGLLRETVDTVYFLGWGYATRLLGVPVPVWVNGSTPPWIEALPAMTDVDDGVWNAIPAYVKQATAGAKNRQHVKDIAALFDARIGRRWEETSTAADQLHKYHTEAICFGKYEGTPWTELPEDYCAWLLSEFPGSEAFVEAHEMATLHLATTRWNDLYGDGGEEDTGSPMEFTPTQSPTQSSTQTTQSSAQRENPMKTTMEEFVDGAQDMGSIVLAGQLQRPIQALAEKVAQRFWPESWQAVMSTPEGRHLLMMLVSLALLENAKRGQKAAEVRAMREAKGPGNVNGVIPWHLPTPIKPETVAFGAVRAMKYNQFKLAESLGGSVGDLIRDAAAEVAELGTILNSFSVMFNDSNLGPDQLTEGVAADPAPVRERAKAEVSRG